MDESMEDEQEQKWNMIDKNCWEAILTINDITLQYKLTFYENKNDL